MANAIDIIFGIFKDIEVILLYGWPFIILIWLIILKFKWKNWPVDVVIIEKRGDNLIKTNDRAGKFIDPYTKIVGYKLQKAKDTIPVINYDWVLVDVVVNNTLFDRFINIIRPTIGTIFLFRYGSRQYKPIQVTQNNQRKLVWKEIKNKNNESVVVSIYEQFDPRNYIGTLDFEVIDWDNMNFMVQEQRASFERRQKRSEFWKQIIVPIAMMVIAALVIIVMFKFSYDWSVGMANQFQQQQTKPAENKGLPIVKNLVPAS